MQSRQLQHWIPAFAGMTILLSLIDTRRNGFARHPGEGRDSFFTNSTTIQ